MKALEAFEEGYWGQKYPAISQSWRRNWEHVVPFFAFPEGVRRIIYTTDKIDKSFVPLVICFHCVDDLVAQTGVSAESAGGLPYSILAGLRRPRTRFPVAAKIALPIAGASGGTPHSPAPPIFAVLGTM